MYWENRKRENNNWILYYCLFYGILFFTLVKGLFEKVHKKSNYRNENIGKENHKINNYKSYLPIYETLQFQFNVPGE